MDLAKKVQEVISQVRGAGDVEVDLAGTSPVLRIEPKEEALQKYGASVSEVLSTITIALGGEEAGFLYDNEKNIPLSCV